MQITINDQRMTVTSNVTVLEAAAQAGIEIPTLCHHADLTPVGSCRMCLVEIAGEHLPQTACNLLCRDGMQIRTESTPLTSERRLVLEFLLSQYHAATPANNEFTELAKQYGVRPPEPATTARWPVDADPNPFIQVDLNQCILCTRCVRACQEIQGRFIWSVAGRGPDTRVVCGTDTTMLAAGCESCGACETYCPTGALTDRRKIGAAPPDRLVRTTCGYCGVGCQFDLEVNDEQVVGVSPTAEAPVNGLALCVKGRYGQGFIHHPDRIQQPLVRQYLLHDIDHVQREGARGPWVEVDWPQALELVARRFSRILAESGSPAMGVLSSAKCTNEENYLMQKFARQILGTNNVDHCARLCHSSTVAGLAMALGSGAMSNSMQDIAEQARAIFVIGSNTTEQHPVFGTMLRQAALRGVPLVVADPRRIDLTEFASLHLRQRPGTDVALLNGIANLAIQHQWFDQAFVSERCESFDEFRDALTPYTPARVAEITGVPTSQLQEAAEQLCQNRPMAVIWAMGITQHTTGVSNVLALANLQMLLGNLGVPGGGVNPLRGQNNVQGACDLGALPNLLPGYQRVDQPDVRQRFLEAWKLDGEPGPEFPARPGLTVTEMIDAAGRGEVRGLYILGEDPAMTDPDSNHVRRCLESAEFVVLQEILHSETSVFADVVLPGASFAEKSGTFTNTERRVQPIRPAISPVGKARPDWQVIADLANAMLQEAQRVPVGPWATWTYASADDVLHEINQVTPIYGGITPKRLDAGHSLQWPVPDPDHPGTPILHVGRFNRGLGKFHVVEYLPPAELPDADYPLLLTTGRVLYHWHGGELTRRVASLTTVCPEPTVEISPDDALRYRIEPQQWIHLESRRGRLRARAHVTPRVAEGVVFGNFHFPGDGNANNLTINQLDPIAKIPEFKVCAVRLEP